MPTVNVNGTNEIASGPFTVAANTLWTVIFGADANEVEVGAVNASGTVYVSTSATDATVGGKHCYPMPPGTSTVRLPVPTAGPTKVTLITSGTVSEAWAVKVS